MSDLDPNELTTTTDLDPTTSTPTPTTPVGGTLPAGPGDTPTYATPQPYEPAVAWAPAVPVSTAAPRRRGGRLRWAAAVAVVAIVLGASAAVAAFITNSATQATVLGYVPPASIVYGEVRLDLPGDQRQAAGAFLSKFPGFKDQAALDSKLDEVLDEFITKASNGEQSYRTDIKPWFGGEVALSLGPLPPAKSLITDPSSMSGFRALALVSVTDATAADAWFAKTIKSTGATTTTEAYNGATLTVFTEGVGPKVAYALVGGEVAVLGDLTSVKAAVDTNGHSTFTSEPGPKAALDSASGDHVGFVYVALRPLMDWSSDLSQSMMSESGPMAPTALSASLNKLVPAWSAYWLSFEDDALVMEATAPKPETPFGPTENRTSTLAKHIPSTAIVTSISNDLGATLKQMLALYASEPTYKDMLDQVDNALGLIGGRDAAIGWIGDTAIVVNDSGGTLEGGVLIDPTDPAAAQRLSTALHAFVGLGGGAQGITIREEPYAGTTITIVDLGDTSKLTSGGADMMALPLPTGHLELAYAVTDDVVVIGTGPAFVKHVLDTTDATSLASDAQYKQLADRAGPGISSAFVDITAIRGLGEKWIASGDASALAKYESDVKPFLVPFDALFMSSSTGSDLTSTTVIITVK